MTLTVNKDVFLHPDFTQDLTEILCNYLNMLIDEEFAKEDADFDFIDECASAINSIRDGLTDNIIPIISQKSSSKKINIRTARLAKAIAAAVAAAIMILTANTAIASATRYNIIQEVSKKIVEIFKQDDMPAESHTQTTTTTTTTITTTAPSVKYEQSTEVKTTEKKPAVEKTTLALRVEVDMTVRFSEDFKKEYCIGEPFSTKGMTVYRVYQDGYKAEMSPDEYNVRVPSDFGRSPGYETITVTYFFHEYKFDVKILDRKVDSTVSSIYAKFPSGYDYKTENLANIDLSSMKIFAVYVDEANKVVQGTEELSPGEYSVNIADASTDTEKKAVVTVTYKNKSCSFTVFQG